MYSAYSSHTTSIIKFKPGNKIREFISRRNNIRTGGRGWFRRIRDVGWLFRRNWLWFLTWLTFYLAVFRAQRGIIFFFFIANPVPAFTEFCNWHLWFRKGRFLENKKAPMPTAMIATTMIRIINFFILFNILTSFKVFVFNYGVRNFT